MNRRSVLGAIVYAFLVFVASRLFRKRYGAVFRVVKIDPDGSGMDYSGHLGAYVYNGQRCCRNCGLIWAAWDPGGDNEDGPSFCHEELAPVNHAARRLLGEIHEMLALQRRGTASFAVAGWGGA